MRYAVECFVLKFAVDHFDAQNNFEDHDGAGPALAPLDEDDGYVSPTFEFSSKSDDDESEMAPPPAKRNKHNKKPSISGKPLPSTLDEEEELALQMLRRGR